MNASSKLFSVVFSFALLHHYYSDSVVCFLTDHDHKIVSVCEDTDRGKGSETKKQKDEYLKNNPTYKFSDQEKETDF